MELSLDHEGRQPREGRLDLPPGLRGGQQEVGAVSLGELGDVPLHELRARGEVRLVDDDQDRDLPDQRLDAVDPVVEVIQSPSAREVGDREDAVRAVEVRVLQELAEPFLAHDVPDHHVDLQVEILRG